MFYWSVFSSWKSCRMALSYLTNKSEHSHTNKSEHSHYSIHVYSWIHILDRYIHQIDAGNAFDIMHHLIFNVVHKAYDYSK